MPLGFTNAPTTFNLLMTDIFHKQLVDCVLVFFDDILFFLNNEEEHDQHVRCILELL